MRTQHLKVTVTSLQNISSLLSLSQEKPFGSIFVSPHFIISTGCLVSNKTQLEVQLPTRIDCLCVGMVVKGCPEPIINQCRYQLAAGDLLIVNWGAILDSEKFSNDIVVKGFAVTEDYLKTIFGNALPQIFQLPRQSFKICLSEQERGVFCQYLSTMLGLSDLLHEEIT